MPNLFTPPPDSILQDFEAFYRVIQQSFTIKRQHRSDLPYAVRDLSRQLTLERGQRQTYWAAPRLLAAYLRYFLPWNLLRLIWLLPTLPLQLAGGAKILDLGSGPLTLPAGFWLARPELRAEKLDVYCSDTAQRPMELGKSILSAMFGTTASTLRETARPGPNLEALRQDRTKMDGPSGQAPWNIRLTRTTVETTLRRQPEKLDLITAGNLLNELYADRHSTLEDRLADIFLLMDRALLPGGQILLLEPGTRLGGRMIGLMRRLALKHGFETLSPCPHNQDCPMLPRQNIHAEPEAEPMLLEPPKTGKTYTPRYSGWCHFSFRAQGANAELLKLSREAGLEKDKLHLSFVLLRKSESKLKHPAGRVRNADGRPEKATPVRVISEPLRLADQTGTARYACSERGLILLRKAGRIHPGELVPAKIHTEMKRDSKSGALNADCLDGRTV